MTRFLIRPRLALATAALLLAGAVLAQTPAPAPTTAPLPEMTDAEVRKVDVERGRLTLRHGPIKHLDMPGMTMVFKLADKSRIASLKPGDKVRVMVVQEGGDYTVTSLEPAP